jgi:hypothetical protein
MIFSIAMEVAGVEVEPLERTQFPSNSCGSAILRVEDKGLEKEVIESTVPKGRYFTRVFFFDIALTFDEWIIF